MKLITYTLLALLAAFSLSCGQSRSPKPISQSISSELQAEIDRITPLLKWSPYGQPLEEPYPSDSSGDAMSMNGRVMLDSGGALGSFQAVIDSIAADGHPYRSPSHVGATGNTFSRDALMGLIEASVAVKDNSQLLKVRNYYAANDSKMCPDANDNRCDVTISMDLLVDEALGKNINIASRALDETTITGEASTTPETYQSYLVMRKLRMHIELGELTEGYKAAIKVLHERFPKHPYASYLYVKSVSGNLEPIAQDILACMKTWKGPGEDWWGSYFEGCPANPQGHELVSFAMLLIRESTP